MNKPSMNVNGISSSKQALRIIRNFSWTSKMPCYSYSLPATHCKTGKALQQVKGTVCSFCYGLRGPNGKGKGKGGWYMSNRVYPGLLKRLKAIKNPKWVDAMVFLFTRREYPYFRWHDIGDLQNVEHLDKLVQIAKRCPRTKFWLPTREWEIIYSYVKLEKKPIPPNLIIRLSADLGIVPDTLARELGVQISQVSDTKWDCPAMEQGHKCLKCRKCWNEKIFCVTYKAF